MCDNGGKEEDKLSQILSALVLCSAFLDPFVCMEPQTMGKWDSEFRHLKTHIPGNSLLCILTFLQVERTDGDTLEKKKNLNKSEQIVAPLFRYGCVSVFVICFVFIIPFFTWS